jgi:hypothetical protein
METMLNWKKGLFKNIYEIYSDSIPVGHLNEKSWTQSSNGELYGEKFHFKTTGFINKETKVFNNENSIPIGKITYNSWMTKGKIEYSDKVYYWKFDNIWSTSWRLYNAEGLQVKYKCSSTKGRIEYDLQNNFLVLTGLYIYNYYWQTTFVILIVVFLPVWVAVFN